MAIAIKEVTVSKDHPTWQKIKDNFESWESVANLKTWGSVYMYSEIPQPLTVTTGETIIVTVLTEDVTWETIKNDFQTWEDVKKLSSWKSVMNYT